MATAAGGAFGLCVLNHSASFFSPLNFPSFQDKACLLDFSWLCRWPASGGLGCLNALVLACISLQNKSGTEGMLLLWGRAWLALSSPCCLNPSAASCLWAVVLGASPPLSSPLRLKL